jgi:uncharacterized protein YbaA (DUF1428 family)
MSYVDGYVLPIQRKNLGAYRKMAALASRVWRDHGALDYRECVGDDLDLDCGMPFPRLTRMKRGETVVFAWIVFRNRKHRDQVNAGVMKDKRLDGFATKKMPFDMKRMTCGGFTTLV